MNILLRQRNLGNFFVGRITIENVVLLISLYFTFTIKVE